jgi:hypothetical protein
MISVRLISAAKLRLYFKTYKHKGKKIGKNPRCAVLGSAASLVEERWHGCSNAEMMSNSTFLRPAGSKPA